MMRADLEDEGIFDTGEAVFRPGKYADEVSLAEGHGVISQLKLYPSFCHEERLVLVLVVVKTALIALVEGEYLAAVLVVVLKPLLIAPHLGHDLHIVYVLHDLII